MFNPFLSSKKSKFPHLTFLKLEFLTRINHTVVLIIQGNLYLSKHTRFFDKVTHQLGLSVFAKRENFLLCQIQSVPYHIRLSPIFNHINTHIIQKKSSIFCKKKILLALLNFSKWLILLKFSDLSPKPLFRPVLGLIWCGTPCSKTFKLEISIYVIVMGIIKCEKVFDGIFIFSSLFW